MKKAELEAELARIKSTVKPSVHVIEGTEYERGWGQRPDGYVAFLSKEVAEEWIRDYDRKYNNLARAPDDYTKYSYIGVKQCSFPFFEVVTERGLKHFDRTSDLT